MAHFFGPRGQISDGRPRGGQAGAVSDPGSQSESRRSIPSYAPLVSPDNPTSRVIVGCESTTCAFDFKVSIMAFGDLAGEPTVSSLLRQQELIPFVEDFDSYVGVHDSSPSKRRSPAAPQARRNDGRGSGEYAEKA
jgi:hypothetical protein